MTHCTWTVGGFPAAVTPRGVVVSNPGGWRWPTSSGTSSTAAPTWGPCSSR